MKVDGAGKITSLKVDRVIDPERGGGPAGAPGPTVEIVVPESYLAAARAMLDHHGYDGSKPVFYTYTLYDPSRPTDANPQLER
jgi:hypothetical protein